MSNKVFTIVFSVLTLLLCGALVIQAFAGRQRRVDICASQNATLAVLHDVIVIATTPPAGKKLTVAQVRSITAFQTKTFARIAAARC